MRNVGWGPKSTWEKGRAFQQPPMPFIIPRYAPGESVRHFSHEQFGKLTTYTKEEAHLADFCAGIKVLLKECTGPKRNKQDEKVSKLFFNPAIKKDSAGAEPSLPTTREVMSDEDALL